MIQLTKNLLQYRELAAALAWKNFVVRYKQAYLGLAWAVLKPVTLMLIFVLIRNFVSIDSGSIPYPVLTFAALMPWIFFQESTSEGVNSIVANAQLIRKIYFPREILPLTGVITKLVELGINAVILGGLMASYGIAPTAQLLWVPIIILYTVLASMSIALVGAAVNVYYRDVGAALPVIFQLMMYASPVIYPLSLVKKTLLVNHAAGEWSQFLYTLYTVNPLAGIIDGFQRVVLEGKAPDLHAMLPGAIFTAILLPLSYMAFKRAEDYFADVV